MANENTKFTHLRLAGMSKLIIYNRLMTVLDDPKAIKLQKQKANRILGRLGTQIF